MNAPATTTAPTAPTDAASPTEDKATDAPRRPPQNRFAETLARLEWLLLLQAVGVVILVCPLRLQDAWLVGLHDWLTDKGVARSRAWDALAPYLCFYYSPLTLRGALAGVPMLAMAALAAGRRLLTAPSASPAASGSRWASAPAFLGWVLLSALWSPTPDVARVAACWALLFGVFFYALLLRGVSGGERRQLAAWLVALGAVVTAILYLQALPVFGGAIFKVMYRFDESDRNLLGSLLGHNTSAASFLLLTWFPAMGLFLTARSWPWRAAMAAYMCAAIFGMVLLQSRAIWIFAPILGVLALRSMSRQCPWWPRLRWAPTLILAACVFGVASQAIDKPWNPFYYKNMTLARRLRDLSANGLRLEARARLNMIGVRLVPEHPIVGHGLFAFQYVYPAKQSAYFAAHPGSKLQQTLARSNMAHDEYLQVLIDHGFVGLGLLAWLGWQLTCGGWRLRGAATGKYGETVGPADGAEGSREGEDRSREGSAADRLMREAFGWSSLALALHATVDFPWHVPPLLLTWQCCVAAWATRRGPAAPLAEPSGGGDGGAGLAWAPASARAVRPRALGRLLGALAAVACVPVFSTWLFVALHGDALFREGGGMQGNYVEGNDEKASSPSRFAMDRAYLESAIDYYRKALRWTPANYLIYQDGAEAYRKLGTLCRRQAQGLAASDPSQADLLREDAIDGLGNASDWVVKTCAGMDYYFNYYQMAQIDGQMALLEPGRGYERKRVAALRRCYYDCPSFTQALYELAEALAAAGGAPQDVASLRRELRRKDPALFDKAYYFPAFTLDREGLYEDAAKGWEMLLETEPGNLHWLAAAHRAELLAGNVKRADELERRYWDIDSFGIIWNFTLLYDKTVHRDDAKVMLMLDWFKNLNLDGVNRATFRAIEEVARRRSGRPLDEVLIARFHDVPAEAWERMVADQRPAVLRAYGLDPKAAREAFERRLRMPGPPPDAKFWIEGARVGVAQGDEAFARKCLAEAAKSLPGGASRLGSVIAKIDAAFPRHDAVAPAAAAAGNGLGH